MNTYDVIIAGCGPAGATAGYLLAREGHSTAMIDRAIFPRPKLCGGLLPLKTLGLLERVFGDTPETLTENGIITCTSSGYRIFFREELLVRGTTDLPFSFIERETYDHYLLAKARSQGARIFEGEEVTGVDADAGEIRTSSGRICHGRFILGADGVHSAVRRCLPATGKDTRAGAHGLAAALEVFVPRTGLSLHVDHPMIHLGYVDWGYAWVFPNRDRIIVGLGGLQRRNTKKFIDILQEYLAGLGILPPRDGMGRLAVHGHSIPYGGMVMRPVHKHVLLVGDAAGLADPITGEGIYYAHRSAEAAAVSITTALRRGLSLEKVYQGLLNRHVLPELLWARRWRTVVFNALRYLPPALIGRLVRWGNTRALHVIHGHRPYPFDRGGQGMYGKIQE
ncbi:MAG TPA: NAD(P)/FAD-dependent oxidoreductase [Deltaproteobacteria bacterium]|mgnify:FL=1|nr:NAD(P)/FAD-dependent oxidoreductase [Deltaproteobacteria bacterium]